MANLNNNKKYHFIYKTTNLLSGKYYIGMHSTNNLKDGYMGSGDLIRKSIKKHGKENHKFEILEFCNSREELISKEKEVVNLQEIAKKECLNLKVGGNSWPLNMERTPQTKQKISDSTKGKSYEERYGEEKARELKELRQQKQKEIWTSRSDKELKKIKKNISKANKGTKRNHPDVDCPHCGKIGKVGVMSRWHFDKCKVLTGKSHKLSNEHKEKLKGKRPKSTNLIWINNGVENKRIKKYDQPSYVNVGWNLGMNKPNKI